ncbi:enoyl-CoA hydratase/isomerase family protein [Ruminococcaceae bacterium OttesenSCG-928-O06]|nr:enoyl-CoA hydratase/isomerase family protein [Ruminococcaceae bacterium OttesenSCG-928-O06]
MELQKTTFENQNGIGVITMTYEANLNALDVTMATEVLYHLNQCDEDPAVKVVLLAHSGKAFSAGGDITFMYKKLQSGEQLGGGKSELSILVGQLTLTIKKMKKLVISCVGGVAAGAGTNLALSADFVFASEKARFIQSFAGVGLVPDTGGSFLLSRILGSQKALELCVTARPVKADEAKTLGLVYAVYPPEELAQNVMEFAAKLAKGPLLSYENIKKQNFYANFRDYEDYLNNCELETLAICGGSEDFREGLAAFVEKREPNFQGK